MTLVFEQRRLKYAASLNDDSLSESTDPDFEVKYVDIGNVDFQGNINELALYPFKKAPSRARRQVKHGDVIISTVRTYLQAIAPIKDPEPNLIVSTGFAVARPNPFILSDDYFKYAARESYFLWEVQSRSKGVSYPAINSSELADILISLPPIEVQQQIAAYIDRETTEIDALVAEKEHMLALIEEKRDALISHTVTRGINSNAPLKPSDLDWLGDVPKHWNLERAKGLFREVDDRTTTGEEELLSLRMQVGLVPHHDVSNKILEPKDVIGFKKVETGQLVINRMRASMGLIAVSPQNGLVSPDYAVFDIVKPIYIPYFLALFNTTLVGALFRSASKGLGTGSSGFLRLYSESFLSIHFPVPPLDEQEQIVDFLDQDREKTGELEKALTNSIALLKERRSALITAAVTGQIEPEDMRG